MLFIFARISDHTVVEVASKSSTVILADYLAAVAVNKGGVPSDYTVYTLNDGSNAATRIREGDEWVPVWTGDNITDVDFSAYDATDKLKFNCGKSEITANGTDTCKITVKFVNPSDAEITTSISGVYVPVQSPLGIVQKKIDIVNGVVQFDFGTATPGEWRFPANRIKKILNYRVKNQVVINALLA